MDNDESLNFCKSCGAPLRDSDTFCKSCGADRNGEAANTSTPQHGRTQGNKNNTLLYLGILSALWAFIALYEGLSMLLGTDAIIGTLRENPELWDMIIQYIGEDALRTTLISIGAIFALSGALSAVTAVLCILKKFYIVALIACIAASICALVSLIGIVGFIVAFFIYKNKGSFEGQTASQ
jgi:hypothetical protein